MPTTEPSLSASTNSKSLGRSVKKGISVDPGLPKIRVIPCRRMTASAASRTVLGPVVTVAPSAARSSAAILYRARAGRHAKAGSLLREGSHGQRLPGAAPEGQLTRPGAAITSPRHPNRPYTIVGGADDDAGPANSRRDGAGGRGAVRRDRRGRRAVSEPTPSEHARGLVRGAYDMHVHVAPDVVERRISDVALAERCRTLGLGGFQLKSHYSSTAERARSVSEAVPGVRVLGAITLNRSVGGLNALAVEIAAREGARSVWFPTVSSVNEQHEVHPAPPGAKAPGWVAFELELRDAGLDPEPVAVVDADGALTADARAVLGVIARHDMVLA